MVRRYQSYWNRFSQPDPYDGSYDFTDAQSFNRYAYAQNDPVNFVDPTGLSDHGPRLPGPPPPSPPLRFLGPQLPPMTFFVDVGFDSGEMIPINPWEKMGGPWWDGEVSTGGGGPGAGSGPQKPTSTPTPKPGQVVKKVDEINRKVMDATRRAVREWKKDYGRFCNMYNTTWYGWDLQYWINPIAAEAQRLHCWLWNQVPSP